MTTYVRWGGGENKEKEKEGKEGGFFYQKAAGKQWQWRAVSRQETEYNKGGRVQSFRRRMMESPFRLAGMRCVDLSLRGTGKTMLMGAAAIKTRAQGRQRAREMKLLLNATNHGGEVIRAVGNHRNDNMVWHDSYSTQRKSFGRAGEEIGRRAAW